jgi:hypothetical protein
MSVDWGKPEVARTAQLGRADPTQTFGTASRVDRLTVQDRAKALWKMLQVGL